MLVQVPGHLVGGILVRPRGESLPLLLASLCLILSLFLATPHQDPSKNQPSSSILSSADPFTPLHHVPSRRAAAYISATNHPLPPHLYFAPTPPPPPPLQHHTCFRKPEHYEALLQLCTIRNPARTPQTPPFLYISFFKQHQHEYRYTTYTLAARAL